MNATQITASTGWTSFAARTCSWLLLALGATSSWATTYRVGIGDDCDIGVLACFSPSRLTISVGDSVEFYNYADSVFTGSHNVVADDGSFRCARGCDGEGGDGTPVSDSICNGMTCVFNPIRLNFVRTFSVPGAVGYHDEVSKAAGTIIVNGPNYEGMWWASPAESESDWGINLAHQGDVIFVTWFTYDANGKAWWLTMTASKAAEGTYSGTLYRTNAAPFSAFVPPATARAVGTGTLSLSSPTNGTFSYQVSDGVNVAAQTKAIVLQTFGPLPTCTWGAQPDLTKATMNYQDLWWAAPAGSESGWG